MKKQYGFCRTALLLCAWLFSSAVWADDFVVDGIYYNILSSDDKTVEVTYKSPSGCSYSDDLIISETVTYEGTEYRITAIGDYAFMGCTELTSVIISKSVTSIGIYAFLNCWGLTSITIPESVATIGDYAFELCSGLTSITMPESVTTIGNYAFENCRGLTEITIPNSVTTIGNEAFLNCENLKNLRIEDGSETLTINTSSTSTPFDGCPLDIVYLGRNISYSNSYSPFRNNTFVSLTIGSQVTTIGTQAFSHCTGLTAITIPNNVTTIDYNAFSHCTGLKNLRIEDGEETLTSIWAFENCPLDTVYLGRNISYPYGDSPFKNKTSLVSLTIGNRVTIIDKSEFEGCLDLKSVTIPEGVIYIGNDAFWGCESLKEVCFNADSCIICTGFSYCKSLETLYIGANVKQIPYNAFSGCTGLTSVMIPDSVTTISFLAFSGCTGLKSVTIGNSVTVIGSSAFEGCRNLKNLRIEDGTEILELRTSSTSTPFDDCPLDTVYLGRNMDFSYESENYTYYNSPFKDKANLVSLTIGNKVTTIDNNVFSGCSGLKILRIEDGSESLALNATSSSTPFENCPLNIVYLGRNIDYSYKSGNDTYYNSPFWGKTNLVSLTIGNQVTTIDYNAFSYTGLKNLLIEDGSEVLEFSTISRYGFSPYYSPFENCPLDTVYIGRDIFYNNASPFENKKLASLTIGNQVTTISAWEFAYTGLKSITIPNSVTSIGSAAFYDCRDLTSVTIGEGVTTIWNGAFYFCSKLERFDGKFATDDHRCLIVNDTLIAFAPSGLSSYIISDGVTVIDGGIFDSLELTLTSIVIPKSVTTIGNYAFRCRGLTSITAYNPIPVNLVNEYGYITVFEEVDCANCTLYVPAESVELYKVAEGWKEFGTILPIDESSAITEIRQDNADGHITVYNLQGVLVLETDDAADLKTLQNGAYIVNGKKMIIVR